MTQKNTISRTEKLKSRKAIEEIFALRQSFSVSAVRVFYSMANTEQGTIKVGFGASKKYFSRAVHRNRAKRLMREAYRTQKHALLALAESQHTSLNIFFLFARNELINYSEMQNTISVILQRLEKIVQKRLTEN